MLDLTHYAEAHRCQLQRLLASTQWQEAIRSGLIDEVRAERIEPGKTRNFIDTVADQLVAFNGDALRRLIAEGCDDTDRLLETVSTWPPRLRGRDPALSFLGLNVTAQCNTDPRCLYCNQQQVEASVDLEGSKSIVAEVTVPDGTDAPYIYVTGGEPLLLGEDLWGDDGLVRFAAERGAAVNINTNGVLMTPEVALRLIKAGLAKVHISLDTADKAIQDGLRGGQRFEQTAEAIATIQLARDLVGVSYPVIHTNCVLTNRNLDVFPELFRWILETHKQTTDKDDPFFNDLFPHVIPVGGDSNGPLRPSAEEFRRFFEKVWPKVCQMWDAYQEEFGVPKERRGALFGYFSNPFLRVEHRGGLDAYVKACAEGCYGRLALARHCYVAPTQACVSPNGTVYRCGSHAIRCILPIGNVADGSVLESIREGVAGLDELPQEETCYGCALATLYINQAVEKKLRELVEGMVGEWRAPVGVERVLPGTEPAS